MKDEKQKAASSRSLPRRVRRTHEYWLRCEYVTLSRLGWTDGEKEFPGLKHLFPMQEGARIKLSYQPRYDQRFVRPSTRGELADRLRAGESCEVAAHVVEMTNIMLKYWLDLASFTVTESPNEGWVIYRPNKEARQEGRAETSNKETDDRKE